MRRLRIGTAVVLVVCLPACDAQYASAERRLEREYLAHRNRSGVLQAAWKEMLSAEVRPERRAPREPEDGSPDVQSQLGFRLGMGSSVELRAWVAEHRGHLENLVGLPSPAGPLPVPGNAFLTDLRTEPDATCARWVAQLCLAEFATNDDPGAQKDCLTAFDRIVRILEIGQGPLEAIVAQNLETLKWETLLVSAFYRAGDDRSLIAAAPDIVTLQSWDSVFREYDCRYVCAACARPEPFFAWGPQFAESELAEIGREYARLGSVTLTLCDIRDVDGLLRLSQNL